LIAIVLFGIRNAGCHCRFKTLFDKIRNEE